MPERRLPVRPDLDQLKHQAKDLLREIHRGEASALADLAQYHPRQIDPAAAKLADAQMVLARSYEASSWARLVRSCRLIDAIWPNFWMNYRGRAQAAPFTELLLDHGAEPNVRASLRKQLHPGYGPEPLREYRDVTALSWGERFQRKVFVSEPAMRLIRERGGHV